MVKVSKKIFNAIFLLLILFIFISISGCSGTYSNASDSTQSSISKEQVTPADPASNNENNQEGVPLPPDEVNGICIVGDHAFAADYMKGLSVYDISKRLNPVKISELDLPGDGMDVYVQDKYAYVACGYEGLYIIDISDIENMKVVSTLKQDDISSAYATRLQVQDGLLFMADGSGGFKIIDISIPESPVLVSRFGSTYQGSIDDVYIEGNTAFLADYRAGFIVVDISDPGNPRLVSETRTTGMARGLCSVKRGQGDTPYILVADHKNMQIIDASDVSKPVIAGTYGNLKSAVSIAYAGNLAFVADFHLGLVRLDITEITKPVLINIFDTGKTNDVCVYEDYVYAVGEKGISVFAIE